nr:hypothetical protein [Tanacetum cinerariifolium]
MATSTPKLSVVELNKNIDWDDVIEHVQRKEKEDNDVLMYQALKRKPQTEAQARKNMMIYLRNMTGFKMDYFKGISYDDIRPIFEKYFNSNVAFLEKTKEQLKEEESRALKRISKSLEEKAAKKHKLDEEVEELKKHLQIMPNDDDDDDVYIEATPLALKIVKERFASSKPKNFSNDFLLTTFTYMFKKPDVQAQVWKNQRSVHGLAKISGNPTFSLYQEITSLEVTHEIHDSEGCNFLSKELLDIDSFNDIHPYFDDNPLSGSTTYSSNSLLEEFTDELARITYPLDYDDNLQFDIEFDLKEIEFLLYEGKDSSLKDSIVQTDLANLDDYFVDPTPEMFTDEHTPDYSSPSIFDMYDDDFLEVKSDADNGYNDPFDSKGEKIKESKLLINELDLPCDFLTYSEYDSFNSQDFSRVDALPSTDNEDKVFNPGILIHEKSVKIITHVTQEKKLAISYASLVFEDFDPPFYEPLFFKDVPKSMMLLLFSSENEEKVFKPGIYTSEKVHSCFLPELSHPGYHVFKVNQIFISLMKMFHVQCGKNTLTWMFFCSIFIPLDQLKLTPMDFVLKSSFPLFKLGIT